jgi:hypothetical protein
LILSIANYDRLRSANVRAFLDLRNEAAAEATAAGLTDERLGRTAERR